MNIIPLLWWSLSRDNQVVPSPWQATPVLAVPPSHGHDVHPFKNPHTRRE
jgi:hypothetical protein